MTQILRRPTLVLNRNWQPVNVSTVARALLMVWNNAARVVDPDSYQLYEWSDWTSLAPHDREPSITSATLRIRVPEVITVNDYDRLPTATVAFSRRNVFKRDRFTCQYCGLQPGCDELTIDHVIPRSHRGQSSWTNCVLACVACNSRKADRTPKQAGMTLRKQPAKPDWRPLYTRHALRLDSWTKFLSQAYWDAELAE